MGEAAYTHTGRDMRERRDAAAAVTLLTKTGGGSTMEGRKREQNISEAVLLLPLHHPPVCHHLHPPITVCKSQKCKQMSTLSSPTTPKSACPKCLWVNNNNNCLNGEEWGRRGRRRKNGNKFQFCLILFSTHIMGWVTGHNN